MYTLLTQSLTHSSSLNLDFSISISKAQQILLLSFLGGGRSRSLEGIRLKFWQTFMPLYIIGTDITIFPQGVEKIAVLAIGYFVLIWNLLPNSELFLFISKVRYLSTY